MSDTMSRFRFFENSIFITVLGRAGTYSVRKEVTLETNVRTYVRTYVHTYIRTYMHTCVHTYGTVRYGTVRYVRTWVSR